MSVGGVDSLTVFFVAISTALNRMIPKKKRLKSIGNFKAARCQIETSWYPEWDSNPQQAGFEPTASASWAIGAARKCGNKDKI